MCILSTGLPFDFVSSDFSVLHRCPTSSASRPFVSHLNSGTSSCPKIHILLANARSLFHKMSTLRALVLVHNPDVICITESWGNADIPDSSYHVAGFNLYRCDRVFGRGGGVLLFVKNKLVSCECKPNFCTGESCEVISCRISSSTGTVDNDILLVCVYRPPHHVLSDSVFMSYLQAIVEVSDRVIICGDFNCLDIDWATLHSSSQSTPLHDWAMNNFLVQGVTLPTRPVSNAVLDLISPLF